MKRWFEKKIGWLSFFSLQERKVKIITWKNLGVGEELNKYTFIYLDKRIEIPLRWHKPHIKCKFWT